LQLKLGNQMANIVHLMLALVSDLSLNISSRAYSRSPHHYLEAVSKSQALPADRTLEERRAFLGCFYVTSMYIHLAPGRFPENDTRIILTPF
jgi:hypothetical protein